MATKCRFSTCRWRGAIDEVFEHCEEFHPNCIKEHRNLNYYDFSFDDMTREAFLLCRPDGIYWFCVDLANEARSNAESIKRGIFSIGDSPSFEYTLKFGLIHDGHAHYFGPFDVHREQPRIPQSEVYEIELSLQLVTTINEEMPSKRMRLYVGEYDDSDDVYAPEADELPPWTGAEAEANNRCIELFTCPICYEYIRKDPRFCESRHYVCKPCFERMQRRQKLRCPICRQPYPYDCKDDRINNLLRMVQFPARESDARTSELAAN